MVDSHGTRVEVETVEAGAGPVGLARGAGAGASEPAEDVHHARRGGDDLEVLAGDARPAYDDRRDPHVLRLALEYGRAGEGHRREKLAARQAVFLGDGVGD